MNKDILQNFLKSNIGKFDEFDSPAIEGRGILIKTGIFQVQNELDAIKSFGKAMKGIALGVLSTNNITTIKNIDIFIQVYIFAEGFHEANDGFMEDDDTIDSLKEKTKLIFEITKKRINSERLKNKDYNEVYAPEIVMDLAAYDYVYGTNHASSYAHLLTGFGRLCANYDGELSKDEERYLLTLNEKINDSFSSIKKIVSLTSGVAQYAPIDNNLKSKDTLEIDDESNTSGISNSLEQLNNLIGIPTVKNEVQSLINTVKISKMRAERGLPETTTLGHFVFHGRPGTGKTTVARLLASALKSIGVLEKGHLIEVDRSGLVAGYVGQTADKAKTVAESALGGILFIDEAYTLNKGGNDFGQEAIDTILKIMEDNRGKLVVIAAGYTTEMNEFINSNPGLKSRFNRFIEFPDYSPEELIQIFEKICKESKIILKDSARSAAYDILKNHFLNKDETFGNARVARNLFQDSVANQANRLIFLDNITESDLQTLEKEDISPV